MTQHVAGRLFGKFLLWLVPSFVTVSAALLFLIFESNIRQEATQIAARVGNHAGRIAAALSHNAERLNEGLASDLLSSLVADRAVRCATLRHDGIGKAIVIPGGAECRSDGGETLSLPIEGLASGTLTVRLSFAEIQELRRSQRNFALLAALVGLMLAIVASMLAFGQTIGRPLRHFLEAIREAARSGNPVMVDSTGRDELGAVIESYNDLQSKLARERQRLRESLAMIDRLYNDTPAPMFCANVQGNLVEASDYWLEFTGYTRDAVIGKPVSDFVELQQSPTPRSIARILESTAEREREVFVLHRSGRRIDSLLTVARSEAPQNNYLGVVTDISHLRKAERALRAAASTDKLTGLPNRTAIAEITTRWTKVARDGGAVAVLYIDLDDFKDVNDTYGHEAGDRIIITSAQRMKQCAGAGADVIRLGGDEFAIVLGERESGTSAQRIAEAIIAALAEPVDLDVGIGRISSSIGIAQVNRQRPDWNASLHEADLAMYEAKQSGKNRYVEFSSKIGAHQRDRAGRAQIVRDALHNNGFMLHFQPIVALDTLKPIGAEALLRLRRPVEPSASTLTLIQTAEETGQIEAIGAFVIDEALRVATKGDLAGLGDGYISINLSAFQLNERLAPLVAQALAKYGVPPRRLLFEITETALIRRFDDAQQVLADLRKLGVRVALDDFGAGYSSLSYFGSLPVDVIKLDRNMVQSAYQGESSTRRKSRAVIRSVASLARDLDMLLVAEGIEAAEMAEDLRSIGITAGQGYLFSRALPPGAFNAWLARFGRINDEASVEARSFAAGG